MFSIGLKLFLGVAAIVALSTTVLFYWLTGRERTALVDAKIKAGVMVTEVMASALVAPLDFDDDDAIKKELENARVNQEVVAAGVVDPVGNSRLRVGEEVGTEQMVESPIVPGVTTSGTAIRVTRTVMNPEGKRLGQAYLVLSLDEENYSFEQRRLTILRLCALLGLGTALVLSLVVQRGVVWPLQRLSEAARKVGEGQAGVRVAVKSRDEVGVLASAFNVMSAAVVDRERRLDEARSRVQDLLDHMRQAIVVFDLGGRTVGIASRAARTLFDAATIDTKGVAIATCLYPDTADWQVEAKAFADWLELLEASEGEDVAPVIALAPREVVISRGGEARTLELEFVPIGDPALEIMLLATDVTDTRALLLARERDARENEALRRILGSGHLLRSFLDAARERVLRCRELAAGHGGEGAVGSAHTELFQHVHTIKGEALAFDLVEVSGAAHDLESELASPASHGEERRVRLALLLDRLAAALDQAERRFAELAPEGELTLQRVPVDRREIAKLIELVEQRGTPEIREVAQRIAARPFGELTVTLGAKVPGWAESVGKQARLEVEGRGTPVPSRLASVLPGVLIHLVRNAVAHGIESPSEREQKKKPPVGLVRVIGKPASAGIWPRFEIVDDGQGFSSDEQAERAFSAGFTTTERPSELSGLGIGLVAVREELGRVGYGVRVEKAEEGGARFVLDRLNSSAS